MGSVETQAHRRGLFSGKSELLFPAMLLIRYRFLTLTVFFKNIMMNKKSVASAFVAFTIGAFIIAPLGAQQTPTTPPVDKAEQQRRMLALFEHPTNLKTLPKNIAPKDLQAKMYFYSKSLGVHCSYCHVENETAAGSKPQMNFASDSKDEKRNARKMILMTKDINAKYLQKIEKGFEEITCVSCHHGSPKPMVSVDSLPQQTKK